MAYYKILALAIAGLALAHAARFSCEKNAFVFADSDPQSQEEFSARNPAAGGIIATHLNNQTTTYHFDNTTMAWVKDPEPVIQCQMDVVTDPKMPHCLNISGMPYCETPSNIVQQIRKNMTEQTPAPDRMPIWVDKVCQNPTSAYVRIMFGQYGAHFLAAYQDTPTLQSAKEYSQNITQMAKNFMQKKQCEGQANRTEEYYSSNETMPGQPQGPPYPMPRASGNESMPGQPQGPPQPMPRPRGSVNEG